jgi:hypothetical protein
MRKPRGIDDEDMPDDVIEFARYVLRIKCPERLRLLREMAEDMARNASEIQ